MSEPSPTAIPSIAQTYPQLAVQLTRAGRSPEDLALVRRSYVTACALFAPRTRGSGKPFLDHLVGTASCVLLDGAPAVEIAAALLHAAYDQGEFGDGPAGATARHRARLRAEVGDDVERLVLAYETAGWDTTTVARSLAVIGELSSEARAVLRIRVANEVDDALDAGLVLSGKATQPPGALVPAADVVALAAHVGGAPLVDLARVHLSDAPPVVAPELVLGWVGSRVHAPCPAQRVLGGVISGVRRFRRGLRRLRRVFARAVRAG